METRKLKIYSTRNGLKQVDVPTGELSWSDLKEILSNEGIDYNGFKAMENRNNSELIADNSIIPADAQMVALSPKKTKSGMDVDKMSYKELRSTIQEIVANKGEVAAEHFNKGKNYTNKSTSLLREDLKSWLQDSVEVTSVPTTQEVGKGDIVDAITNLPDYEANQECYDKAIDLIMGDCEVEQKKDSISLDQDEIAWLNDMGVGSNDDEGDYDEDEDEYYDEY